MEVAWKNIGPLDNIPVRGARRLCFGHRGRPIAVFRTGGNEVFALIDECPHQRGPLSEGIVSGHTVTCPLHNWVIGLKDGLAVAPDEGRTATAAGARRCRARCYVGLPARGRRNGVTIRTTCPYCGVGCGDRCRGRHPARRCRTSGQFRPALLEGRGAEGNAGAAGSADCAGAARPRGGLGRGARSHRRRIRAHSRASTGPTPSPSMSPASSSPRTITSPTS